jgi:beta-glucanase (GH16 family)
MKIRILSLTMLLCGSFAFGQEGEYKLVWADEFDAEGRVNEAFWGFEQGFVRNHEAQWYQADNAFCKNGVLVIEARQEKFDNPLYQPQSRDWRRSRQYVEYTAASVNTRGKAEFLYGRFEIRAKIPTAPGVWPAIWTLGVNYPWPSNGEIDIMEYYRIKGVPHILANAAWGGNEPNKAIWNSKTIPFSYFTAKDLAWADKFHIWRMDWDSTAIRLYLDNELLNETLLKDTYNGAVGNFTNPFRQPHYLLLNLALGGDNGGEIDDHVFPQHYEIDYLRVYQTEEQTRQTKAAQQQPQTQANANRPRFQPRKNVPLDSIRLSDPAILADTATKTYYMTGTGGMLWKSRDLRLWDGPYRVAETDPQSWMGERPAIWAAELHAYKGKYYYFATFTNENIKIDTVRGNVIPRRASHILVSDKPEGPYRPMKDATYLPAENPTLDGTFWVDTDGKPYMIYCGEWLQNWNGTVEKIELKPDLSGSVGKGTVLFRAFDSPWSREKDENGNDIPNKVTDGCYLFRTQTGRLGMLWTSWVYNVYTQGVAYSSDGTLNGRWMQEKEPITPPDFGHGMLFRTFEGKLLMSVHSHKNDGGRYVRIPHLFEVDDSGDKIVIGKEYRP